MSMHTEWDTAGECGVEVMTAADATETLWPDEPVEASHVLVLGGAGGGCLAVEGSLTDLLNLASEIRTTVMAAMIDRT